AYVAGMGFCNRGKGFLVGRGYMQILSNKPLDHKRYQGYLVEDFMVYYVLYSSTRHTPSGLLLSNPGNIPLRSSLLTGGPENRFFSSICGIRTREVQVLH